MRHRMARACQGAKPRLHTGALLNCHPRNTPIPTRPPASVMVEAANEVGLINMIGGWLEAAIRAAPPEARCATLWARRHGLRARRHGLRPHLCLQRAGAMSWQHMASAIHTQTELYPTRPPQHHRGH